MYTLTQRLKGKPYICHVMKINYVLKRSPVSDFIVRADRGNDGPTTVLAHFLHQVAFVYNPSSSSHSNRGKATTEKLILAMGSKHIEPFL